MPYLDPDIVDDSSLNVIGTDLSARPSTQTQADIVSAPGTANISTQFPGLEVTSDGWVRLQSILPHLKTPNSHFVPEADSIQTKKDTEFTDRRGAEPSGEQVIPEYSVWWIHPRRSEIEFSFASNAKVEQTIDLSKWNDLYMDPDSSREALRSGTESSKFDRFLGAGHRARHADEMR